MSAFTTNYQPPVETYRSKSPQRANTSPSATSPRTDQDTSPRAVSFCKREEEKDKRQKYLTARYGQHQMMLIRKRLAVEDWLYEKLREMYNCVVSKENVTFKIININLVGAAELVILTIV